MTKYNKFNKINIEGEKNERLKKIHPRFEVCLCYG